MRSNSRRLSVLVAISFVVACALVSESHAGETGVGPTNGVLSLNFLFSGKGCGSGNVWCYDIVNNTGTLTVRGKEYQAVAYYTQLWPGVLRWIDIFGIATDGSDLSIFYLDYKYWEKHVVTPLWEEDWSHTLTSTDITKAPATFIDRSDNEVEVQVSLPALTALPEATYDAQITIHQTDEISFTRTTGWVIIDGSNYTTTPISTVNCDGCPKNCPECTPGPWYEIHMALSSEEAGSYCFGIYYIYPKDPSFVQLNYTLCVPQLTMPAETYKADWSGKLPPNAHMYIYSKEGHPEHDQQTKEEMDSKAALHEQLHRRVRREVEEDW